MDGQRPPLPLLDEARDPELALSPEERGREMIEMTEPIRDTVADGARFQSDLRSRLGAAAWPAQALWPFLSNAIFGVVLIGGVLLLAATNEQKAGSSARFPTVPVVPTGVPASTPTPPIASSIVARTPAIVSSPGHRTHIASPTDRLAEEVELLARATRDLHSAHASDALNVLDEYGRKFPNGLMTEERCVARVQALCALGRQREALAELDQLAPESLAAARAKESCDASSDVDR